MQTTGKYDSNAKMWIIKAATKGGIVIAAASTLRMAIELLKSIL